MSEVINNREYRQKVLKELIMELHAGKPPEDVHAAVFKGSIEEIHREAAP